MARDIGGIAGIILTPAGRDAGRFDRAQLLQIRAAAERAMYGGLAPLVAVTGIDPAPVAEIIIGIACKVTPNPAIDPLPGDALHAGLRWVPDANDAAVVLLADMDDVTSDTIRAVRDRGRDGTAPLVASRRGKVPAPPLFIRRTLFGAFLAWRGSAGDAEWGAAVVRRHRRHAEWVEFR